MRINLRCPFQDKDLAKQLGARWDAALRVWYVENASDLAPFARWLPDPSPTTGGKDAANANTVQRSAAPANGRGSVQAGKPGGVITGPAAVADCGCAALPWESCDCAFQGAIDPASNNLPTPAKTRPRASDR